MPPTNANADKKKNTKRRKQRPEVSLKTRYKKSLFHFKTILKPNNKEEVVQACMQMVLERALESDNA